MITELLGRTSAMVELAQRLKTNQTERNAMAATLAELDKLAEGVQALSAVLRTCRARLGDDALTQILTQAVQIAQDIDQSRLRFATNRRENLPLNNAGRRLQTLIETLAHQWRSHAQQRLAPHREMRKLVGYLPETAASQEQIDQLFEQLERQSGRPPQSEAQLALFDQRLVDLTQLLSGVAQLSPEVRIFLDKVISGGATVADVTPAVSAWLAQEGRAMSFAISFRATRSLPT